jgi:TonB family protein
MKVFLCFALMLLSVRVFAQDETTVIRKDTINLRGIIYQSDGRPAKNIQIMSRQFDLQYDSYPITTTTDTSGCFVLKGAKPNDTLTVLDGGYHNILFTNRGSRFMVIYLPVQMAEINSSIPIEISAARKYPKVQPTFHVMKSELFDGGCTLTLPPQYPGGMEQLTKYIKHNLTYPEKAITYNIEGTVEVAFTIQKNGALKDAVIIKGIGYGCDEEVLNLIKKLPYWRPGIYCKPYSIRETLSVKFSLSDN